MAGHWLGFVLFEVLVSISQSTEGGHYYGNNDDSTAESNHTAVQLPDEVLRGLIVVKIKSVAFIRELANPNKEITKKFTTLCEKEMSKIFHPIKGKQTAKIGSFRQGRRNKVIIVMDLDSTGNGNASEITDIIEKNIKKPGKFLYYDIDQSMTSFTSYGVCCQPKLHYSFDSHGRHTAYDYSGYDNNGDVKGRVHRTHRGRCGKGAQFNNGFVTLRHFNPANTSNTDSIAVMFWIRSLNARKNSTIFQSVYNAAVTEVRLQNGFLEWMHITEDETIAIKLRAKHRLRSRVWTHVACVYDPYTMTAKMYINSAVRAESRVTKGLIEWKFTGWLQFGLPTSEGFLDDLYVYDCILGEDIIKGVRRTCSCNEERCAPRGNNEFLIRLKLFLENTSKSSMRQVTKKVEKQIKRMFDDTTGEQQVQTLGYRPVDVDKVMVDYSLRSAGNSNMRYLAGILQPAVTSGSLGRVDLTTNDFRFVPVSGASVCRANEMKCSSAECVNNFWKCDGEINCKDGSDEINCGIPLDMNCSRDEYKCNTSRVPGISDCVDIRYQCDGQLDCEDDSDEKNCLPPKVVTAPRSLIILAEGETASCTCAATGVPPPLVSWHISGREVTSQPGKVTVTSVAGRGTLTIFNLEQADSGDYICNVRDNRVRRVVAPSCTINVRAFGKVCVSPFFNSAAQTSSDCLRCFCHHRTNDCQSAKRYRSQLSTDWDCADCDEFTLVERSGRPVRASEIARVLEQTLPRTVSYYWKLPSKYLGNKLTSYGGKLQFSRDLGILLNFPNREKRNINKSEVKVVEKQPWNYVPTGEQHGGSWFDKPKQKKGNVNNVPSIETASLEKEISQAFDVPSITRILNLTEYDEVVMMGNDGNQLVSARLTYLNRNFVEVKFHEESWKDKKKGGFATKDVLLSVLSDVKDIFINARSSDTALVRLTSVSLDTAVSEKNGNEQVHEVEHCACPVGYTGLSCQNCAKGYFRLRRTNTCMKCSCYNHSITCDPWSGQCINCLHGTEGPNCQYCVPGLHGNAKTGTVHDCKPCKCPLGIGTNQFSEFCYLASDGKQTCTKCDEGYTGRNCERCARGYDGDPISVGGNCYKVGNFSQCDMKGSLSQDLTADGEIKCVCKANVIGSLCQTCRSGTFNLHASNPDGCEKCFCNRIAQSCTSLRGVKQTITASFIQDDFILSKIRSRHSVAFVRDATNDGVILRKTFPDDAVLKRPLYWVLPQHFAGSKVKSYGDYLEYTVTYNWEGTKELSRAHDVIILGKRFGIIYSGRKLRKVKHKNKRKQTFRVWLKENVWRFSSGSVPSKHLFMLFLVKMEKIMILATPKKHMNETILHDVTMGHVIGKEGGELFPRVETCLCPEGYIGHSCETCASGYRKIRSGLLPRCTRCNCHGHSEHCDVETGQCQDCQHNTTGHHCEKCVIGYYGDATSGSATACRSCPCPYISPPNRFSFTCFMDEHGLPVCDNCPEGHEGSRCERCKPSYVGNPLAPGDFCKPVSSCGCDGRGSQSEQCDDKTQRCSCKRNVQGEKCTECRRGFYNLQSTNPQGCTKCFCMGLKTTCKPQDFYREQILFKPSSTLPRGLTVTIEDQSQFSLDFFVDTTEKRVRFLNGTWLQRPGIYWTLPDMFLGNQVMSYGGVLIFSYFYALSRRGQTIQREKAVQLQGRSMTIYYRNMKKTQSNIVNTVEIILLEKHWEKSDGSSVSRPEFLKVLVQLDAILVRASHTRTTTEISLGEIKMNVYSLINMRQINAPDVEICDCPQNYIGTSCESCAPGYTKNGDPFGDCVPCQCNEHSHECDQYTGHCRNCQDNSAGIKCEQCVNGYYGNARRGTRQDCRSCPCPLRGSINRFSETCFMDKDGVPTCDACQEGYTGRRCEKCSPGYTGNPLTPGGKCLKGQVELVPKVKIIPGKITILENDNVTFVCHVTAIKPAQIVWSRDNGKSMPRRAKAQGKTLTFQFLKKSDAGKYVCTANSDFGLRTAKATLAVKEQQVSAVIVTVSPKSRYIPVGGTAKFTCSSKTSSKYSIKWTRENNKPMPSSARVQDGTLFVTKARMRDGGTYICTGQNALNKDRAIVSLHVGVIVRAQASVTPKRQVVDVAQAVTFRCSASAGFPAPTLKWNRGGRRSLPLFSTFVRGLFKILAASRRDEGEYMCIASNTGGSSVMKVQLLVKGPNSAPRASVSPPSVAADEGRRVLFRCEMSGDPELSVGWSKEDGRLPRSANVRGQELELRKISLDDQGVYVCTVRNRYGSAKSTARLNVNRAEPKKPAVFITPEGSVIPVMEGKSIVLQCHVRDLPKPTMQWQRLSKQGFIANGAELKLDKMKLDDTGIYVCLATTEDGEEGRALVSVIVERTDIQPKVHATPTYVEARLGDDVTFSCKAHAAAVYWVRADKSRFSANVHNKDSELRIRNVAREDEGTYICLATNKFGSSKATAELRVNYGHRG